MRWTSPVAPLACAAAALVVTASAATLDAQTTVWGVQAASNRIVAVDPTTGAVRYSFAAPGGLLAGDSQVGLTYAAPLNQLFYRNTRVSSTAVYRLDPLTGAVIGTFTAENWPNQGMSYERVGGTDYVYYAHANSDVHRGTPGGSETYYWSPGVPSGGLGGDGYGREFGIFTDGIREYSPSTEYAAVRTFAAPGIGATGLAFDGTSLFASIGSVLYTLNPNTGAVITSVSVAGGALLELGSGVTPAATVPEPATVTLFGLGAAGVLVVARRRRREG